MMAGAGREPNEVEGEDGSGWAVGRLAAHGNKFQFYSKATGSPWRVVSWGTPRSDMHFKKTIGLLSL